MGVEVEMEVYWTCTGVKICLSSSHTLVLHLCLYPSHQLQQHSQRDRFSIYRHQQFLPSLQGSLNIPASLAADNHVST